MSLVTILQETYPKGVHVFGSNDITERKKRLRTALADSSLFPYTKGEDSNFTIFATMTIKAAGTQPEATLQFEPGFEGLKSAPGLTRDLFEMLFQLLSASRVWEFIEESGCDYTLGVDYSPYLDERTFPGQRTSINQDFDGKRKLEKFSTISQPTRKIDRIESGARGKVERRLRWQGAKDVTFKDDRAFMRVEVRADGGERVRATYG